MTKLSELLYYLIERATFSKDSPLHYEKLKDGDLDFIEDELYPFLCRKFGHSFELDQCCNPLHDYCCVCRKTVVELGYKRVKNDYPQEWEKI